MAWQKAFGWLSREPTSESFSNNQAKIKIVFGVQFQNMVSTPQLV
jgi:hypothetical protein